MVPVDPKKELRAHRRAVLLSVLRVYEPGSSDPLGTLEDLSLGGFRLSTRTVIADLLEFEAECRWLRASSKGPGFECGFEFTQDCVARLETDLQALLRRIT